MESASTLPCKLKVKELSFIRQYYFPYLNTQVPLRVKMSAGKTWAALAPIID